MDFCPVLVSGCATSGQAGWTGGALLAAEWLNTPVLTFQGGLFYTINELKEAKLGHNGAVCVFRTAVETIALVLF